MEIESEESNIISEDESIDMQPLDHKGDKKLVLTHQAESAAFSIANRRIKTTEFNRALDTHNSAQKSYLNIKTKEVGSFEHFLTKNKHRDNRKEVFEVMRELAQSKDFVLSGRVIDKLEHSKMILRVVAKEDSTLVMIEDETGKQKMMIRSGTVWVGMIALMEVSWSDNCYKLDVVYDLGSRCDTTRSIIHQPNFAYRMMFVKGSLMRNDSKDNIGLRLIVDELRTLKEKERVKVNCLVIMGPLLNSKNEVLNGFLEKTYEEQAVQMIQLIKQEITKKYEEIQLVFMPSTDDLTSLYPVPQPKYSFSQELLQNNLLFTSNPGIIELKAREKIIINLVNLDLLNYIDENRAGRAQIEVMQDNLETYFKQPFYLTNTMDQPFDETNLPSLYNAGSFGDIVVTSSRKSPPFAREVKGRVFMNIGSLGIDQPNDSEKHYMTLVSIYDGSGPLAGRTKVQVISM